MATKKPAPTAASHKVSASNARTRTVKGEKAIGRATCLAAVKPSPAGQSAPCKVAVDSKTRAKPLRMKVPKSKERSLIREFGLDVTTLSAEEIEKRRSELTTLVKLGKTRGFLTQQEINDHLPEKLVDAEVLEAIVKMLNDMGIAVYEQVPDAATLLGAGGAGSASTDDDAEEAAEAAVSTVDSEFGRTTDPVRMYMREMALFELLTREGEIEIAKRIEGGLQAMMLAVSASPAIMFEILGYGDEIAAGELIISAVVDGFVVADEADDYVAEEDVDSFDNTDEDDDGSGASRAMTRRLDEMKVTALERFASMRANFDKLHKALENSGYGSTAYRSAQKALSRQLMTVRFTAMTIDKLCSILRSQVEEVRRHEREIRRIAVDRCGMPQERFVVHFPPNALNLRWVEAEASARKPYSAALGRSVEDGVAARGSEGDQQEDERRRAFVTQCQAGNDRGQPAPGHLDRQEVHQPWHAVPRSHPRGQRRLDEGGRKIRIPPRIQVAENLARMAVRSVPCISAKGAAQAGRHSFQAANRRSGAHGPL